MTPELRGAILIGIKTLEEEIEYLDASLKTATHKALRAKLIAKRDHLKVLVAALKTK